MVGMMGQPPKDDDLGLEDAWETLRGRRPDPESTAQGSVWMGVGRGEDWECSYPSYERIEVPLHLDGTLMSATFKTPKDMPVEDVSVTWAALWFQRYGGRPLYVRRFDQDQTFVLRPGDSITMDLMISDDGGYITRILQSLDLL